MDVVAVQEAIDEAQVLLAAKGTPTYAPAALRKRYAPERGVHNWKPDNTRRLRYGLGRAAAGGQCSVVFVGDSIFAGYTNGSATPAEVSRQLAIPISFRDALAAKGIPSAGTGLVRIVDNTEIDYRWTNSGVGWSAQKAYATVTTPGAFATFTPDRSGTHATVWYFGSGQTFTISVNGASSGAGFVSITAPNDSVWRRATLAPGGIVAGSSTVVITLTSGTLVTVGASVWTPNAGLTVDNIAQGGSKILGTDTTAWSYLASTGSLLPAYLKLISGSARTVTDGVFTAASTAIGSATGFSISDIGKEIVLPNNHHEVPPYTYITAITDATHAVMSQPAAAGSTGTGYTVTIGRPAAAVVAMLGANDHPGTANTVADMIAGWQVIAGQIPAGTDLILGIENQENSATLITDADWEAYAAAVYTLAETLDVPLIDLRHRIGNWASAVATTVAGDNAGHMNAGAYVNIGKALAEVVTA